MLLKCELCTPALHLHPKLPEAPNRKPETFTVTQETGVTFKLA